MNPPPASEREAQVRTALDRARLQLLDLTFRTNLLNYRVQRARGALVVGDTAVRVGRLLVEEEVPLGFVGRDEAQEMRDSWQAKRADT
jgi:hypothetical protein